MAETGNLIDFDIIENQKENIQSLPSGRSAKSLATVFSPQTLKSPPSHTQTLNDAVRADYEKEIASIDDSDDPLDVYDRYVKWTLDAYPTAQATPASQLLPLLERATKAFLSSSHYKNDPRYLKLWLHYIRFFSDAPRETFAYLSRHGIGESLALFYEEFAAWLENAGRWKQAEEVYKMGIEREARPMERLTRRFGEFERRGVERPHNDEEPSSPALPTVRPALATKIDPFALVSPPAFDPQAANRNAPPTGSKKQKLQIFSDNGEEERPSTGDKAKGWETIGTLADRKKENTVSATPWNGEKMNMGSKQNVGMSKMMVFKDESTACNESIRKPSQSHLASEQRVVNPKSGRIELICVNLEEHYPNPDDLSEEYCFEEIRAAKREWLQYDWGAENRKKKEAESRKRNQSASRMADTTTTIVPLAKSDDDDMVQMLQQSLQINDENVPPTGGEHPKIDIARKLRREERANRTKKIKVREVRAETQTIQTNLESPRGPKIRKKKSNEQTMTLHTRAATDEIYEMFNETLHSDIADEVESEAESEDEDDYTSAGESTGTGRISATTSEFGDETQAELTDTKSVEPSEEPSGEATQDPTQEDTIWSDFTKSKHVPKQEEEDEKQDLNTTHNFTLDHSVAEQNFGQAVESVTENDAEEVMTPTSPSPPAREARTKYIPVPPEGYDPPTRPYRDPEQVANNRLPFMTPIVEKTESSLGTITMKQEKDYFSAKTPCPKGGMKTPTIAEVGDVWSSPFEEQTKEDMDLKEKIPQPELSKDKVKPTVPVFSKPVIKHAKEIIPKGPIIKDLQCNPMDEHVHKTILAESHPSISTFDGYFDHRGEDYGRKSDIRKFCKSIANVKGKGDKTTTSLIMPPVLSFDGTERKYTIRRELGKGAFAPVYLAENIEQEEADIEEDAPAVMGKGHFAVGRSRFEALKSEEPPTAWEFFIIRTIHRRLGVSRAAESIVRAHEMHLYRDECYLVEEYRDQGTLLDLVNVASAESSGHSALDEHLAMFFTVELLRTLEALHAKGIIHGDLKADNVLVRLDTPSTSLSASASDHDLSAPYRRDGTAGWSAKGVSLIDFGRGIDLRAFPPDAQFIADWPTSATDCAEMRELRPWTFQADYHGLAAIAHTMLYGRYIETVADKGGALGAGATKTYRLKEGLKRWWQTELWGELFALLLNSARSVEGEEGGRLPVLRGMRGVREKMERYLEENGERGVGLRATIRRMEALVGAKRRG